MNLIDFLFGFAWGLFASLVISWIAPGPLPRARQTTQDTHLYLHDGPNTTIIREFNHEKMRKLAVRVVAGRPLTFEAIAGKGRIFSVPEWKKERLRLKDRGLIDFGRGNVVIVTDKGLQTFDRLARGQ